MEKAYKYRIYPNKNQQILLAKKFAKYIEENMKVTQYNDSRFYFPDEYEATVYIGFEDGQEKQNF